MKLKTRIYLLCSFLLVGCNQPKETVETQMTEINNPILPGYFADPSLVQYEGKFISMRRSIRGERIFCPAGFPRISGTGRFIG